MDADLFETQDIAQLEEIEVDLAAHLTHEYKKRAIHDLTTLPYAVKTEIERLERELGMLRRRLRDLRVGRLTAGLGALATDYGVRIENFLDEYLGSPDAPVPFGGRSAEMAALDVWLADSGAPPYALLAAEAGRGKSVLLVRWAAQVGGREGVAAVFVPVSIRFETSLASVVFPALAARLGEVYEEPVKWANLSVEEWRGGMPELLGAHPTCGQDGVVILDGLDEAADWQAGAGLFPRQPAPGVRAVVSARYAAGDVGERDWCQRLEPVKNLGGRS